MGSVSFTPLGTVLIIRSKRVAHVAEKSSGELARLSKISKASYATGLLDSYLCIVTLPSLEKMRRSELVVVLCPDTSTLAVVPSMYSVALQGRQW